MVHENVNATSGETAGGERTPRESSLLIGVDDVATMLGCSARHVWRLADSGKMPKPYRLGGLRRWDRATLQRWIADGCPPVRNGGAK